MAFMIYSFSGLMGYRRLAFVGEKVLTRGRAITLFTALAVQAFADVLDDVFHGGTPSCSFGIEFGFVTALTNDASDLRHTDQAYFSQKLLFLL